MSPRPGVVHNYCPAKPKLVAFEHSPPSSTSFSDHDAPTNYLLFIGGMGDGLHSVPIVSHISPRLPRGWRLVEVLIASSYLGWGTGSLARDVEDMAQAVEYFRNRTEEGKKVVIMGHSTGSQDVLKYLLALTDANLNGTKFAKVDGAILQAPVSDREAIVQSTDRTTFLTGLTFAESFVGSGQGQEVMPISMRPGFEDTPISAERWFSITAPLNPKTGEPQGDDDLFSSDISPATLSTTFGHIPTDIDLLVLYSGKDEFVPPHVDKEALVGRWKDACKAKWSDKSGIVSGGTHAMNDVSEEVVADFLERIKGFLTAMANVEDRDVSEQTSSAIQNQVEQNDGVADEQKKLKKERREGIERKDAEDALTVKEAAERALGAGLRDVSRKSSIDEAGTPTLQDSPTVTEVPEKQSSQKNDEAPAAPAKSANDGSMKPTEVEEPAVKPTEVEEPAEQVDQQDSKPTAATVNPAGTEVKEVKEAKDKSEVELPLAQAPENAS